MQGCPNVHRMNIDEFRAKLRTMGVDVPAQVLKNWAYSDLDIIHPPVPVKHGKGSGIRGRSASWNEKDIPTVAAVWALRHHPTVKYRPMLELVPHIKQAARWPYETPTTGYDISAGITSYEQIKISLQGRPDHLRENLSEEKWQALLLTWIAAFEKAKRGISIKKPQQICFHWRTVEKDEEIDYIPEKVNGDHVSLHPSESGLDEIIIIINGSDYRKQVFKLLKYVKAF
jgi:hypothetical protein